MADSESLGSKARMVAPDEAAQIFMRLAERLASAADWMKINLQRTDKTLVLFNLMVATANYLETISENIEGHVSILALSTRGIYEVNLQTRDILSSAESLQRWLAEAVTDKIQVLEGILELETVSEMHEQRAILTTEIERLQSLRSNYGFDTTVNSNLLSLGGAMEDRELRLWRDHGERTAASDHFDRNLFAAVS